MKNLHYLKKFVVMVLAAMMTLSTFALPTFAAENKVATINGVEGGATVVGYQFVEQDGETYKWKPKAWVGATELEDKTGFTFTHGGQTYTYKYESTRYDTLGDQTKNDNKPALEALANKARTNPPTAEQAQKVEFSPADKNAASTSFTGTLNTLGSYIVIVDSNNETDSITVYSPMVVSMAYGKAEGDDDYTLQAGSFTVADAKKSNVSFDKNIKVKEDSESNPKDHVGGNANVTDDTNKKGDTLKPGDETTFQITATAPKYSEDFFITQTVGDKTYTGPTVKITDSLDKLTLTSEAKDFVVKFNDATLDPSKYSLKIANDKKSFELVITDKATLKAGGNYVIEYDAVLDDDANVGFIPNTNTAKYEYTRKPGLDTDGKPYNNEEEEITYHYTFDIDGNINGNDEGHEIIKVGIDNYSGQMVLSEKNFNAKQTPLPGAVFELKQGNTLIAVAESAADGRLKAIEETSANYADYETQIKNGSVKNGLCKLDAGDYKLTEVKAPTGYDPYPNAIDVSISATLYNDTVVQDGKTLHRKGMLQSYSVIVNGKDTNTYTWSNDSNKTYNTVYKYWDYEQKKEVETTDVNKFKSMATNIVNTQLSLLPSTGGMGTVLFTVGGVAIMALALFLLFGGKKKQHQK